MKVFMWLPLMAGTSLMAGNWEYMEGLCSAKEHKDEALVISHVQTLCGAEHIVSSNADIATFENLTDAQVDHLYGELAEQYAHFYVGKSGRNRHAL